MVIKHCITGRYDLTESQKRELLEKGLDLAKVFGFIYLPEGKMYYDCLPILSSSKSYTDTLEYEFTKEEVLASDYNMVMWLPHTCGYPKPESSYEDITYDQSKMCRRCHAGMVQKAPFHISKAAKGGLFMFTAWVSDALFASRECYEEILKPLGLGCMPVLSCRKGPIEDAVQVVIPVAEEPADMKGFVYVQCSECGAKKYRGDDRPSPFFPIPEHPKGDMFLTRELFGSGFDISHNIIISAELRDRLLAVKALSWKYLAPCAKPSENAPLGTKAPRIFESPYQIEE